VGRGEFISRPGMEQIISNFFTADVFLLFLFFCAKRKERLNALNFCPLFFQEKSGFKNVFSADVFFSVPYRKMKKSVFHSLTSRN
jgi:hypothetical protein